MSARVLRPGPASLAGLEWLVRVGPAPMAAWAAAMGRGDRVARSHASRLERAWWLARHRMLRAGHRPDLTIRAPDGLVPLEVELQRKSVARMHAILTMYRGWIAEREIAGVAYVCGSQARADRVGELAADIGIPPGELRIELLSIVRAEAQAGTEWPAVRSAIARGA